jgi:hypothetical protein
MKILVIIRMVLCPTRAAVPIAAAPPAIECLSPHPLSIRTAVKKWLTRDRGRLWLNTARCQQMSDTESSPCAALAPPARPLSARPLSTVKKVSSTSRPSATLYGLLLARAHTTHLVFEIPHAIIA